MTEDGNAKRELFFEQNPRIYGLYREIKHANSIDGYAFTINKIKQIKEYAIRHTKFYSQFSIDDEFPVMTKLDFIKNYNEISSNEEFGEPFHVASTSGSTGTPFSVKQNYMKRIRTIADLKVYGEYANYPSHERMLQLRAYNGRPLDRSIDEQENIWRYDISNLNEHNLDRLLAFICNYKPRTIFGYVSTLDTIADYVLNAKMKVELDCQSVIVGAEMLTDEIAAKVQAAFGCPIFDRYSSMEMGIYAQREYGKTNFIVNKASYGFEILKMDSNQQADEDEVGRIVFTDLFNYAFPMIRYDTGDLGAFCYNGENKEITKLYGRKVDCIYSAKGELISPHSITNKMWGIQNIVQWQFIQKAEKIYLMMINSTEDVDEEDLCSRLSSVLGADAQISIEHVDNIPVMNSQKRKYIVNEMQKYKWR